MQPITPRLKPQVMIATVSKYQQIVTASYHLLCAKFGPIEEVYLILTNEADVVAAAAIITQQLKLYGAQVVCVTIEREGKQVTDVVTEEDARLTWDVIDELFYRLTNQYIQIHLDITAGRKITSLFAMASAQLRFRAQDTMWYLHTKRTDLSAREVPTPDDAELIPVPLYPSKGTPSFMEARIQEISRRLLLERIASKRAIERTVRAEFFEQKLDHHEVQLVDLLAEGYSNDEIAQRLGITATQVSSRLNDINTKLMKHYYPKEAERDEARYTWAAARLLLIELTRYRTDREVR